MAGRRPLPRPQFVALLEAAIDALSPEERVLYDRFHIDPRTQDCSRVGDGTLEPLWVVASEGAEHLAYDDVEGEFGSGRADDRGVLRGWGLWGSLGEAIRSFRETD